MGKAKYRHFSHPPSERYKLMWPSPASQPSFLWLWNYWLALTCLDPSEGIDFETGASGRGRPTGTDLSFMTAISEL